MIVCTAPGCQTTAGCQCGRQFPYYPPQVPTLTTGGTGDDYVLKSAAWDGARASYRKGLAYGRLAGIREAAALAADLDPNDVDVAAAILALAERG